MRHFLLFVLVTVVLDSAQAAPMPVPPPAVENPKQLQAEARLFAQQLGMVVDRVVEQYVRPVRREDLLEAALTGLFQAARKPVPRDLRAQIRQAVSLSETLRADSAAPGKARPNIALTSSNRRSNPVDRLLIRLRMQMGNAEALGDRNCLIVACRALAKKLDSYSGVVTAEEQRRAMNLDQESVGVGVECRAQLTPGPFEVETVQPGSPAQRAGLRPGDIISHLDGQPTGKADPALVLALRSQQSPSDGIVPLAQPAASGTQEPTLRIPEKVRITYRRAGEKKDRSAMLIRERFRPETVQGVRRQDGNRWDYLLDAKAGIAHVRVRSLSRGTSEEIREVLVALRGVKAKGLILDLRWCPGGYFNESVETADLFLGEGLIATIKSRGKDDVPYRGTSEGKFRDFKVVVLVNADTSGGAELIAAALQDHRQAVVVGQRTLGKASIQTPITLGLEGTGFKLTSGTFIRPSGKNLHRFPEDKTADTWGVLPDEDVRLSPELGRRLKEWWKMQSLRPTASMERLPLDDPRADSQQQAALAVLRKKMK